MLISLDKQIFSSYSPLQHDYTEINVDPPGALEGETDHMIIAFTTFSRHIVPRSSE